MRQIQPRTGRRARGASRLPKGALLAIATLALATQVTGGAACAAAVAANQQAAPVDVSQPRLAEDLRTAKAVQPLMEQAEPAGALTSKGASSNFAGQEAAANPGATSEVAAREAGPRPLRFANIDASRAAAAQPKLASAPDPVKAFGLEHMPELFKPRLVATPELPSAFAYGGARNFPNRPYIPDLFGAEKCPERGPGFYRIKGSSSCIHVGGRIGAGVQISSRGGAGAFTYGRIQADIVTPSEIGDLTLTMAVQGAMASNNVGPIYMGPRPRLGAPIGPP